MFAQTYSHRVEIQERVEVQDSDTGELSYSWITATDLSIDASAVPARVLSGAGRETQAADAKQASVDYRINLSWFPGLTETHRILWEGLVFDIVGIGTDETARLEYRLTCKSGLSAGG